MGKRKTLEMSYSGGGGTGYSWFLTDITANLAERPTTLFFQDFGLRGHPEVVWKAARERWVSMDYDRRWDLTVKLYPHALDDPRAVPLQWEKLRVAIWWWRWWKRVSREGN